MQAIFGIPISIVLAVVAALFILGVGALLVAALRNRLLLLLALRNVPRRPAQSFLIALGLALATVIVATALQIGDTMSYTIRSLVAGTVGRADEVIVKPHRDPRRFGLDAVQAVANGTFLTGTLELFDESEYQRLSATLAGDERIAALAPAMIEQVVAVNLATRELTAQVRLQGLPRVYPAVFGGFERQDGTSVSLADLPADAILLNAEAAAALQADVGQRLRLYVEARQFEVEVMAVVRNGDLGVQPTIVMPLDNLQRLLDRPGQINQILVANQGSRTTSVQLSQDVARAIRPYLVDDAAAKRLQELLRSDVARAQVTSVLPSLDPRTREQVQTLLAESDAAEPSSTFKALAADPDLERRILSAGARLGGQGRPGRSPLANVSTLRVIEVKRMSQELADRWGSALTTVFVILGLFSIATGVMLIVLIFVLLAAERRSEMGVTRALGAKRRHLIAMFLYEGLAYDLAAAAIGLLVGITVAVGLVQASAGVLSGFGIELRPQVEPRSLVLAYCLGAVITMASIAASAWQASRLTIVAAIKDLPEPERASCSRRTLALGGLGLLAGAAGVWWGGWSAYAMPLGAGIVLAVIGLSALIQIPLLRVGLSAGAVDRLRFTLGGLLLLGYWLVPSDVLAFGRLRPLPRNLDLFFLAGLSLVLGAVWLVVFNLDLLGRFVRWVTEQAPGGGLVARTALAFPTQHRFRTGMTVAMFGLVIFTMVVASVLLTGTHRAYSDPEAMAGGYEIRIDQPGDDTTPLRARLDAVDSVRPDDFAAIGTLQSTNAEAIQPGNGLRTWRSVNVQLLDDEFMRSVRSGFSGRAIGYPSDDAIWAALRARPGMAVVAGPIVPPRQSEATFGGLLRLDGIAREDTTFSPLTVWVRDSRGGGSVKLTIVGILDPRATFGTGIYTSSEALAHAGAPPPQKTAYYLRTQPGVDPSVKTVGLNLALSDSGLQATEIGADVRRILGLRMLLNQLLQAFIGIGLLAGIAGLGVLSTRAVVERRQQIGMLRALGFKRRTVQASFLLEASLVALLGIFVGTLLGLGLAYRLVEYLGREFPEIAFSVPWWQIAGIIVFSYLAAMATTFLPAWQASRIQPAQALRYE
ncbi:MAG: ABC transporter permease [Chloroflexi bacterium]|nr:ABC transporter permease [Chloroflexota bacterium]